MADPVRNNPEERPIAESPHVRFARRTDYFHAAAEARTSSSSPAETLAAFKRRFAELGSVAPVSDRTLAEGLMEETSRIIERRGTSASSDDDERNLISYVAAIRRLEARIDLFHVSRRLVPDFFQTYEPRELAAALREGARHPRYLAETLLRQNEGIRDGRPPVSPNDVLRDSLPESCRAAFSALTSDRVPERASRAAMAAINQISSRSYPQAMRSAEGVLAAWPDAPEEIRTLPKVLVEQERDERSREQRLYALQGEMYESIVAAHPERRGEIERRRRTEEIFRLGNLVGSIEPVLPTQSHSGAPFKVVLEHMGETRVAVVKFAFAERYGREGVMPGNGHWREVAGAMHAFAFGLDAPAVVARRTEGFGEVTVMELVDGRSCNQEDGWFLGADGFLRPELGPMAVEEYLKFRTDGAPRNNMLTADKRIVPIDHGSDMPSDPDVAMGSVALFLMADSGDTVTAELQDRVRAWAASPERRAFEELVGLFPEDMSRYLAAYGRRIDALIATFGQGQEPLYPRYRPIDHKDFGTRFLDDYDDLQFAHRQPRASVVDVTAPRPRGI